MTDLIKQNKRPRMNKNVVPIRASEAYPIPALTKGNPMTHHNPLPRDKTIQTKLHPVEVPKVEEGLRKGDHVITYVIAFIQLSFLIAKGVGYYYGDIMLMQLDWLWVVSPLWVTYGLAIIVSIVYSAMGIKH